MFLTIDIGTSFIKTACIEDGKPVGEVGRFSMQRIDTGKPYEYEYDLDGAVASLRDWIDRSLLSCAPKGILLSTQMHGFLLRREGKISPYISWQDEKSLQIGQDGKSTLDRLRDWVPADLIQRGGVNLKSELALCGLMSRLDEPKKTVGELYTLGSYVIYSLTGKNVTHETNAAPTGFYDIYRKEWNLTLISFLGLEGIAFPKAVSEIAPCGEYKGIPVYPDIGDQQATLLGVGLEENTLNINIGTASQMTVICNEEMPRPTRISEIRPYFGGKYIRVVSKLPGGRSLQVLTDFFEEIIETFTGEKKKSSELWDVMDRLSPPSDNDLAVGLGFFPVLLFPEGSIRNINGRNLTTASLMDAAYRNMAESYLKVMSEFNLKKVSEICISSKFAPAVIRRLKQSPRTEGLIFREATAAEAALEGLEKAVCTMRKGE